jgi:acyl-CoA synthetase (AMP-forming)/AMP-acid ligase II
LTALSNSENTVSVLHGGLERARATFADRPAIRAGERHWTFADLDAWADGFASTLAARGVGAGDRVAVLMTNRAEFLAAVEGISKLGAAAVLLSPAWKAAEVAHALAVTGARHAVAEPTTAGVLTDVDVVDVETVSPGEPGGWSVPAPGDEAVLVFSSGTTGLPKAVRHTHASMGAAVRHWIAALGLTEDDRFQVATPPSHILGLLNLLTAVEAGVTVRLHARFDLDEVLAAIEADRITLEMAVAPIALAIANHPDLERYDLSSLRYIMWGATPVTESVARAVTERTGVRWLPAYGASELPVIAANPVDDPSAWRLDSAGLPAPDVELRVVDLDDGRVLPTGEVGELQARSPSLMAGYLPSAADADAFVDGWYRTGDIGWLEPEGWVHLTDRSKEMIKVKGFQVAPAELEAVLHGHAAVVDCAVFGVPDDEAGEVPVAAVQLDPDLAVTTEELERLVADTLATYKRLREVVVVDEVPRLPSGKVLRRVLRDRWLGVSA